MRVPRPPPAPVPAGACLPACLQLSDKQLSAFLDKADAPSVNCCKVSGWVGVEVS